MKTCLVISTIMNAAINPNGIDIMNEAILSLPLYNRYIVKAVPNIANTNNSQNTPDFDVALNSSHSVIVFTSSFCLSSCSIL